MVDSTHWHSLAPDQVLVKLQTQPDTGLSPEEAARRLEQYGRNELQEQPRPGFLARLLNQFKDMVVILLIVASVISAVLGEWPEAIAIILIVILNAILGVVQEGRAEAALAALKKLSAPEARVLRGSHVIQVPEAEVVPGDIVILEAGNYMPADLRLIETANLQIEEASLTGESVPSTKNAAAELAENADLGDRKTMAYKSTIATYGRGKGVVIGTGMNTEIGKIAAMIQAVEEEETPLQRRLNQLGRLLAIGAVAICALVFLVQFGRAISDEAQELGITFMSLLNNLGEPGRLSVLRDAAAEAFLTAVALAVAAVPEGLPAIVTINLALGMREMIARNALIRRLPAVETLGSASAICSDKTGTLTQNEMTVTRLYVPETTVSVSGQGYMPVGEFTLKDQKVAPEDMPDVYYLLRAGLLCSDALLDQRDNVFKIVGDPTEGALVVAAHKAGMGRESTEAAYPRVDEIPFDATRKRMSTLHRLPENDYVLYVKGAPDFVLELCTHIRDNGKVRPLAPADVEKIKANNIGMAQEALRVLAIAERRYEKQPEVLDVNRDETGLTFLGLQGMIDPARPEVKPAIMRAREAGIKTVMVTGDYPDTARAIAAEIGLLRPGGQVVTGAELSQMDDATLQGKLKDVDVFARVSPEHKVRIVDAFRQQDYVVAMTGDGVNDAPALKRASIGVAMGITGTDVSKETADMVLTDDNYASIVNAVEQGRIIYDNIRKFVAFLLTCNLAEIMVIFLSSLAGAPSPLTAIQLLWLNLLTDGAPALALGVEKGDPNVMDRPPRPQNEPIIDNVIRAQLIVQTIAKTAVTLIGYFTIYNPALVGAAAEHNLMEARSVAFTVLAFSELLRAYSARSELFGIFKIGAFSNKWMQYAVAVSVILLLVVIYVPFFNPIFDTTPLTLRDWAEILPLIIIPTIAAEITKIFLRNGQKKVQVEGVAA